MIVEAPALMFKRPRKIYGKHKTGDQAGQPNGNVYLAHSLIIDGEQVDLFADTDLTAALNGSGDHLDTGAPVEVVADLELSVYRGRLSPRLVALREATKTAPKG